MKYVSITGKDHFEEHPIDNDAIEYAARITAEAHTLMNSDDPWVVSVRDPDNKAHVVFGTDKTT